MPEVSSFNPGREKVRKLKLIVSWVGSSILMLLLFYFWHGIILTDISRVTYPKNILFLSAILVYIVIGFVLVLIFYAKILTDAITQPILRGLICGVTMGLTIFLMTIVIGVSFSTQVNTTSLLFDCSWQCIEQGLAGVFIGSIHKSFRFRNH